MFFKQPSGLFGSLVYNFDKINLDLSHIIISIAVLTKDNFVDQSDLKFGSLQ